MAVVQLAMPAGDAYERMFSGAFTIVSEHTEAVWKDHLSFQIRVWSSKVARTHPKAVRDVGASIQELAQKILVNPLDGAHLQNPVLERTWVWEKWMYDDYVKIMGASHSICPFDGQPLAAALPHTFAQKIMTWLTGAQAFLQRGLQMPLRAEMKENTVAVMQGNRQLAPVSAPPCLSVALMNCFELEDKLQFYFQLAKQSREIQKNARREVYLVQATDVAVQVSTQMKVVVARGHEARKQDRELDERKTNSSIEAMGRAQRMESHILEDSIAAAARQLQRTESALQAERNAGERLQAEASNLKRLL